VTKSFTDVNNKITTASAYYVYLANYDLDAKNFAMTLDKPLTADDQVRMQRDLAADRRDVAQRLPRHRQAVADAGGGLHDDVVCAAHRDVTSDQRDHPATASASGAWLAWQIATASASAAWSGVGTSARPSSA